MTSTSKCKGAKKGVFMKYFILRDIKGMFTLGQPMPENINLH